MRPDHLVPTNGFRKKTLTTALIGALLAAGACADAPTAVPLHAAAAENVSLHVIRFRETGATVNWNERATTLAAATAVDAARLYAYLGLAQFRAAEAAAKTRKLSPPIAAAIGAASATVLSAFFPLDVASIEAALEEQKKSEPWWGARFADFEAGAAIGRGIGARVMAYAAGDRIGLTDPLLPPVGPPPVGPGRWIYSGGPIARGGLGGRPFFLKSQSQIRPAPPPVFGSAQFNKALAEVREFTEARTPEQTALAIFWNVNQSPRSNAAIMDVARELIVAHHTRDSEAARIMFLLGAATYDAAIACFEAKYTYWYVRPPQVDPGISTVFNTPPHPSYPSAHSCISGAAYGILAAYFPAERSRLKQLADEASLSRLYAGIHYRFDMTAGLSLGRDAAKLALTANLRRVAPLP